MKKRILASLLCAAMALGTFSGCSSDGGASSSEASSSSGTSSSSEAASSEGSSEGEEAGTGSGVVFPDTMTSLTVELFDRANIPESQGTLEDNQWTRWVKEEMQKLNVDVTFVPVPRGEETTKLNVLLASGTAPDISFTYDRVLFAQYASDGGLTPLDDYMDTYGKTIVELFGSEILDYGVLDGVQYAVPARRASTSHYMSFIRKDWLDELGLEVPTTKAELKEVLVAFKERDPDCIPWGIFPNNSSERFTCHSFALYDAMYSFFERDDEQDWTTPEPMRTGFKDFMQWLNELYAEGLIDQEFATKTTGEIRYADGVNDKVGFYTEGEWTPYGTDSKAVYRHLLEVNPDAEYVPVECFENADGHYYKTHYPPIGLYLFVPTTCESPEAAVTYMNWQADGDVAWRISYGDEGVQYEMEGDVPKIIDAEEWQNTLGYISSDLKLMYNGDPIMPQEQEMAILRDKAGDLGDFAVATREMALNDALTEKLFNREIKSESDYGAELTTTCDSYWSTLITSTNFEADYEAFVAELESKGINEIIAERTEYYNTEVAG